MPKAVLFDLDGTLLPYAYARFEQRLFAAMHAYFARVTPGVDVLAPTLSALAHMMAHDGSCTNEEAFWSAFAPNAPKSRQEWTALFLGFYRVELPRLGEGIGGDPAAREVVEACRDAGCAVVLATNPVYPRVAIAERLRWAGLEAGCFDHVTTLEEARTCKPSPRYYAEVAARIGVAPADCVMVDNEIDMDIRPAAAAGMRTVLIDNGFQVRGESGFEADHELPLADVSALVR